MNINRFYPMDFHMHSCYSEDGEYTPSALIQMCIDTGLTAMAITDHNCVLESSLLRPYRESPVTFQ